MDYFHRKLILASVVVGLSCVGWALDYYVAPGSTGECRENDPGDLTACVKEYATSVGDVIHLAPGTYKLNGCLGVKPGVALIGDSEHAEDTVLKQTATGDNVRVLYLNGEENMPNTLRNLTITGGYTIYQGGGVGNVDFTGSYTASNCVVENCSAAYQGGGACRGVWYDSIFRNNQIFNHENGKKYASRWDASGAGAFGGTYYRCRFENNSSVFGGGGLGGAGAGLAYAGCQTPSTVARAYDCVFVGNTASYGAGAFSFDPASLFLEGCTFISNKTVTTDCSGSIEAYLQGGGVYAGTLTGCTFAGNTSGYGGGSFGSLSYDCVYTNNHAHVLGGAAAGYVYSKAAFADSNWALMTNCLVQANTAGYGGGGLYRMLASNCVVTANRVTGPNARVLLEEGESENYYLGGGGVNMSELVDCTVTDNEGGGVPFGGACHRSSATRTLIAGNSGQYGGAGCFGCVFRECILSNNVATFYHGIACYNCSTYNCIVTGNRWEGSSEYGRGVLCRGYHEGDLIYGNTCRVGGVFSAEVGGDDVVAVNCTVADNAGTVESFGASFGCYTNCVFAGNGTDVQGGATLVHCVWQTGLSTPREGCRALVDPKFAGAAGVFSPYELRAGSPCRDAGARLAWMDEPEAVDAKDVAGNARVVNDVIDIGAFEFDGPVSTWIFVR